MSRTLDTLSAYPAAAIAAAEAPLTRGTEAYMHAAAQALTQAAAEELRALGGNVVGAPVLVLVGGGHNGGDALLAGALLARQGCEVTARLATEQPHAAALAEARRAGVDVTAGTSDAAGRCGGAGQPVLVIDGLTGIGAAGALRPRAAELVAPLIAAGAPAVAGAPGGRPFRVLAVDLPSGTGVDDGTVEGPVLAADRTVTFTCLRGAHLLAPAADLCGRVDVVDLGLPVPQTAPLATGGPRLPDGGAGPADAVRARRLRVPGEHAHKYTRGGVEVWAGSETYPGAAVLTCSGACRAGAGMVRLAAPRRVQDLVLAHRPETVPAPGRHQALVIGPGTDPEDEPRARELRRVLSAVMVPTDPTGAPDDTPRTGTGAPTPPLPAVIDAGALALLPALLAQGRSLTPGAVLTPHAGEAASLLTALGRPTERPEAEDPATAPQVARELARHTGACVLLKGTPTVVAAPDGTCDLLGSGPGWLATAGSGDVLAGVLGCLLAAEQARTEQARTEQLPAADVLDAAACAALAVRVHALAATLACGQEPADDVLPGARAARPQPRHGTGRPVTALDVAQAVPAAVEHLLSLVGES